MASCSRTRPSTGCTRPNRSRDWMGGRCSSRAARCWADRVRSTACSTFAASTRTMIAGGSVAMPAGAMTTCCPISRRRKTSNAASTSFTASAARCRCPTGGTPIRFRKPLWWRRRKPAFPPIPTSTARPRKAPDFSRPRPAAAGGRARHFPIFVRRGAEATCTSKPPHRRNASCSRDAAPARSNIGRAARSGRRRRARKSWYPAAPTTRRNCCNCPASGPRSC